MGDDGSYTFNVPYTELNNQTFPGTDYRYAVIITEGDSGQRYAIQKGPLTFESVSLPS